MRQKILILYGLTLILGCLTGFLGALFQAILMRVHHSLPLFLHFISNNSHLPISFLSASLSMMMVWLSWKLVVTYAPEASGSGVPEIEGALAGIRPIHWRRLIPVKFIGGLLSIGAHLVLGREGPSIQMGGNLGAMLSEWSKMNAKRRHAFIASGAAAGLATAFNAPLAGALFVIEEMRGVFKFSITHFTMVVLSTVSATYVAGWILGDRADIPMGIFNEPSLMVGWIFIIFGIAIGIFGIFFHRLLMGMLAMREQCSMKQKGWIALIFGAFIGWVAIFLPDITGGGYSMIEHALAFNPGILSLIAILIARLFLGCASYSLGVPGGIFAPLLALGALFGLVFSNIFLTFWPNETLPTGLFAVIGMGALFSATIGSPLTGIVLVVEMTQNYSLILPLMVSCVSASVVAELSKNPPIYTRLLRWTLLHEKKSPIS